MTIPSKFRLSIAGTVLALLVSCSDESPRFPSEAEVEQMYSSYSSTGGSSSSEMSSSSVVLSSSSVDISSSSEPSSSSVVLSSSSLDVSSSSEPSSSSSSSSSAQSSSSVPSSSSLGASSSSETSSSSAQSSSSVSSSSSLNVSSSSVPSSSSVGASSSSEVFCGEQQYDSSMHFCDTRNNKIYKLVEINGQVWMAQNLNYASSNSKCGDPQGEKKCSSYYDLVDDNTDHCEKYGRLYNWETAITICPSNWHLPDSNEWKSLNYTYDEVYNNNTPLFDSSYFDSGYAYYDNSELCFLNANGYWWSSSNSYANDEFRVQALETLTDSWNLGYSVKSSFFSVRCIKDSTEE
jgi:uncharacterized protein (TIGR02145 family)